MNGLFGSHAVIGSQMIRTAEISAVHTIGLRNTVISCRRHSCSCRRLSNKRHDKQSLRIRNAYGAFLEIHIKFVCFRRNADAVDRVMLVGIIKCTCSLVDSIAVYYSANIGVGIEIFSKIFCKRIFIITIDGHIVIVRIIVHFKISDTVIASENQAAIYDTTCESTYRNQMLTSIVIFGELYRSVICVSHRYIINDIIAAHYLAEYSAITSGIIVAHRCIKTDTITI